jgi:hypothetical protein
VSLPLSHHRSAEQAAAKSSAPRVDAYHTLAAQGAGLATRAERIDEGLKLLGDVRSSLKQIQRHTFFLYLLYVFIPVASLTVALVFFLFLEALGYVTLNWQG